MSSLIPPENRNASSSGSPMTIRPPVRAWTMLSMPSRSAVPGRDHLERLDEPGLLARLRARLELFPGSRRHTKPDSTGFYCDFRRARRDFSADPRRRLRDRERARSGARRGAARPRRAPRRAARRSAARSVAAPPARRPARSPNLRRLGEPALGVGDRAQLAGQARARRSRRAAALGSPPSGDAARGARDGERDREVGARLVDAHAADDVDEHVGAADADAAVAAEHGEHEREPVAVDPVDDAPRRHELGRARRAPAPRRAAAASPPSPRARRCRARASPRRRSARRRRAPRRARRRASRTRRPRWSSRSGS